MRKIFTLLVAISILAVACDKETPAPTPNEPLTVESVTITPSTYELLIGESIQLEGSVLPEGVNYTAEWLSTNSDVVTVDNNGLATGVASGTAIIMLKAGEKTGSATINVVGVAVESITLEKHELELTEGEQYTLRATVLPDNADNKSITWSSSDPTIATVSGSGQISALRAGEVTITAKAGQKEDSCAVTISAAPLSVGDFYYSDGTWSQSLDGGKEVIGVVFYVGDITQHDPLLKAEHPHCTHGLVVALDEQNETGWQTNYQTFNNTVGNWIVQNTEYETITSGYNLEDNLNRPMGYHNTKAIEAFNSAEENAAWRVEAVDYVVNYRSEVAAPETSSGWYLGSSKEMSLLVSGEYGQNIWDIRDQGISVENKKQVNKKLAMIEGALQIGTQIPVMMFYWTSTEFSWEYAGLMMPMNGQMPQGFKSDNVAFYTARAILAF